MQFKVREYDIFMGGDVSPEWREAIRCEVQRHVNHFLVWHIQDGFIIPSDTRVGDIEFYIDDDREIRLDKNFTYLEMQLMDRSPDMRQKWAEYFERIASRLRG